MSLPLRERERFEAETVYLDGYSWKDCEFVECVVIWNGTKDVDFSMGGNSFSRCRMVGDFPAGWVAAGKKSQFTDEAVIIQGVGAQHLN